MKKKRVSISTKLSIGVAAIILLVDALAVNLTGHFFSEYCLNNYYDSAETVLHGTSTMNQEDVL